MSLPYSDFAAALDVMDHHEVQRQLDERVLVAADQFCQGELHLVYAMPSIPQIIQVDEEDTDLVSPDRLAHWGQELTAAAKEKLDAQCASLGRPQVHTHVLPDRPAGEARAAHGEARLAVLRPVDAVEAGGVALVVLVVLRQEEAQP